MAAHSSSSVNISSNILTPFVHASHGPGERLRLSSRTKSDNNPTELGLTGEKVRVIILTTEQAVGVIVQ